VVHFSANFAAAESRRRGAAFHPSHSGNVLRDAAISKRTGETPAFFPCAGKIFPEKREALPWLDIPVCGLMGRQSKTAVVFV
jgi:hypothetical protein